MFFFRQMTYFNGIQYTGMHVDFNNCIATSSEAVRYGGASPFLITTPQRGLRSANTNLLSAPRVRTAFASRGFSVAAPQSGTHSHLAFTTLPLPIPFVTFLKLTASSRPSAPPSDSPKCLGFGHWLTLCTLNIHLLTYLLAYLLTLQQNSERFFSPG